MSILYNKMCIIMYFLPISSHKMCEASIVRISRGSATWSFLRADQSKKPPCRSISWPNWMVDNLVSRYRPPELLLGERHYGPPVDMWGAGCVMAEMWTRSPIMQVDFGVLLHSITCDSWCRETQSNTSSLLLATFVGQ